MKEYKWRNTREPSVLDLRMFALPVRRMNSKGFLSAYCLQNVDIQTETISDVPETFSRYTKPLSKAFKPYLAGIFGVEIGATVRLDVLGHPGAFIEMKIVDTQDHHFAFHGLLEKLDAARFDWLYMQFIVVDGRCSQVSLTLKPASDKEFNREFDVFLEEIEESRLQEIGSEENITWYLIHTAIKRMLADTTEAHDLDLEDDLLFSIAAHAPGTRREEASTFYWQWNEEGTIWFVGFAGGPIPEKLSEKQRVDLQGLGWCVTDQSLEEPCILMWDGDPEDFSAIADVLLATLRIVYGVKADWLWYFTPLDSAVEIFGPSCDQIFIMKDDQSGRDFEEVVSGHFSFVDSFETPVWLRPWN